MWEPYEDGCAAQASTSGAPGGGAVLSFELEAAQDAQGGGQDEEQEAARRSWLTQRDLASVDSFSGTFSSRRTSEILGRYHGRTRPSSVV